MAMRFDVDLFNVRALVEMALAEDLGDGDLTVRAMLPGAAAERVVSASIVAKAPGVIAGQEIAAFVYQSREPASSYRAVVPDGSSVNPGDVVATLTGPAGSLLSLERVALNFLGPLSGVATLTRRFVDRVAGLGCEICDTRKTTPGFRMLQKYATAMGGATNHRFGLYDAVMLKENHLRAAGVGIGEAIRRCRDAHANRHPPIVITAEATTLAEAHSAIVAGADIVMLDNFTPEQVREAVARRSAVHPELKKVVFESSGGITLETVREFAEAGVERISIGALTHSTPVLDLSCLFDWTAP